MIISFLNIKINKNIFSKARGLMFSRRIKANQGILFINNKEGLIKSIIHTLFVFYPIKVIWMNSNFKIVDIKIVKSFSLLVYPKKPAKYILEVSPKALKDIKINDTLKLK